MKFTVFLAAVAVSAGAMAQDTTRTPTTGPLTDSSATNPPTSTTPPSSSTTSPSASSSTSGSFGASAQWPSFESLDTNADGKLSSTEAQMAPSVSSKFSTLDKQGLGYITREQYQSQMRMNNGSSSRSNSSSSSSSSTLPSGSTSSSEDRQ